MMRGPILFAAAALLAMPSFTAPAAARVVPLAAAERAAVTINVTDLLANEPRLPLPVRQRADALVAYYQENGGPLLWVGRERMEEMVARLRDAAHDGSNRTPIPPTSWASSSMPPAAPTRAAAPLSNSISPPPPRIRLRHPGRPAAAAQGRSQLLSGEPDHRSADALDELGHARNRCLLRCLAAAAAGLCGAEAGAFRLLGHCRHRRLGAGGAGRFAQARHDRRPLPALRARGSHNRRRARSAVRARLTSTTRDSSTRSSGSRSAMASATTALPAEHLPRSTCRWTNASPKSRLPWSAGGGCRRTSAATT